MKPSWLIQTDVEGVDTGPMIAEVTSQGMVAIPIQHNFGEHFNFGSYDKKGCIICYGDIDFVRQVNRYAPFVPGAWCNFNNMQCSIYYAYLGEYLLNRQYLMMPIGDLLRRWVDLSLIWYDDKQSLFIRPNSGTKLFTGHVVASDELHKIQALIQTIGQESLVVISPEKVITTEWRFVICDRKVVTGCQYLPHERPTWSPSSFRLAEIIAEQEWQPDLCYTVDIAESEGDVYLLEINSFSCAGLYYCDMQSIVKCTSAAAVKEWKEYV